MFLRDQLTRTGKSSGSHFYVQICAGLVNYARGINPMSAIFISHSSRDHADTEALASWLRQQGHTSYFIDYDEQSGIRAGTDWAQVLHQRLRQCQVAVALVTPDWLESKWCFGEMVLARENGKPIFPIKLRPCQLPDLLSGIQSIDLTVNKESGYRRLAAGLKQQGLDPADVFDPDPTRPPYPGFPAFEEADAALFFGRSAEILSTRETLEGLRRHSRDVPRLVLVLGASGSGKSSLVRAGLIPRLKKDEKNWLPLRPFRPQEERSPLDALAFAFAEAYKDLRLPCDGDLLCRRLHSAADSAPVDGEALLIIARDRANVSPVSGGLPVSRRPALDGGCHLALRFPRGFSEPGCIARVPLPSRARASTPHGGTDSP